MLYVYPSLQVMNILHQCKVVVFDWICSHWMHSFLKAWVCKNRTLFSLIAALLDLQPLQFTFTVLPLLYCVTFGFNKGGTRGFLVPRMRWCHFWSCASYRSAGTRKFCPVFTTEHLKVAVKWTKDQPIYSPIKEDSKNIYFVGVCSCREKRRGENVNVHEVPFPPFKFCQRKLSMSTELPESLIKASV